MRAFVFPGQGSQKIGMGRDLAETFPAARDVFNEVDDALDEKLSALIFEGSDDDLRLTENTQPALMAVSLAVVRALEAEFDIRLADHGSFVAGHSLGEYAALAAVGALPVADTARLLRLRGRAMQSAVPVGEGAMAAVLGLSMEQVEAALTDVDPGLGACEIANDNAEGQVVISGAAAAVAAAGEAMKAAGAKRALPLPVSAPFHCSMMQPAADAAPEITTCPSALSLATSQAPRPPSTSASAASTCSMLSPSTAAMAPSPTGTADCMARPRRRSRRAVSATGRAPTAASAAYSPSE